MLRVGIAFRARVIYTAHASRTRTKFTVRASMDQICVFGATERELRSVEEHLQRTGPLSASITAPPGETPASCSLAFYSPSAEGQPDPAICGLFEAPRYFASLQTSSLGRTLFTAASTASTQAVVQGNIAKLPDGVVFVADKQIGGKGRGGNTWESPPGCLMFSAACRLAIEGQRLPFVQYLVTLAVVQAAQAEARAVIINSLEDNNSQYTVPGTPLNIAIKWPNDVYSNGLKIGGILCHSSFREGVFHVIMGVGLNVSNRQPTTCLDEITAVAAREAGVETPPAPISRERLLAGVMTRLEPMLLKLAEEGFRPFEADYYSSWLHSGQQVQIEESENEGGGGMRLVGVTIRGLSPHGYLMAEDENREVYELHPDGNSFDFFKGLVRKKLPAAGR